ncbi:MAG: hypothetical protein M1426_02575, partial [Patescibacteria group bacterium]|nr:hypothetical protein [Patescibacteria group bacterium]
YGWADSDFKIYHPPLYYFWHCPNCHFTESFLDFEAPGKPGCPFYYIDCWGFVLSGLICQG